MRTYKINCDHFGAEDLEYKHHDTDWLDLVAKHYVENVFFDEPASFDSHMSVLVSVNDVEYIVDIEPAINTYARKP